MRPIRFERMNEAYGRKTEFLIRLRSNEEVEQRSNKKKKRIRDTYQMNHMHVILGIQQQILGQVGRKNEQKDPERLRRQVLEFLPSNYNTKNLCSSVGLYRSNSGKLIRTSSW